MEITISAGGYKLACQQQTDKGAWLCREYYGPTVKPDKGPFNTFAVTTEELLPLLERTVE